MRQRFHGGTPDEDPYRSGSECAGESAPGRNRRRKVREPAFCPIDDDPSALCRYGRHCREHHAGTSATSETPGTRYSARLPIGHSRLLRRSKKKLTAISRPTILAVAQWVT